MAHLEQIRSVRTHASSIVATLMLLVLWAAAGAAATITVTSTGDAIAVDGAVTLREAITSINAAADANADVTAGRVGAYGTADTIVFNITGVAPFTITPASALPTITVPTFINGYSQTGSSANTNAFGLADNAVLTIVLNGAAGVYNGLTLQNHTGSVIRGLVIQNFGSNSSGVQITGTGGGHTVAGCFIGTNVAGTAAGPGNGADGVLVNSANNTIGGVNAADRNIISANGQPNVFAGVELAGPSATGNLVQGNYIGTTASGAAALGNSTAFGYGVIIFGGASTNTIGGAVAGAGNVISANGGGVTVQGGVSTCTGNVIAGNRIGTNSAGTAALGNAFAGVGTIAYANGTRIGGTNAAERNVISGNGNRGIVLGGSNGVATLIQGNYIGTDLSGTAALGNTGDGIRASDPSGGATIGGIVGGAAANVIAFNTGAGVDVFSSTAPYPSGFAIWGNSIHDNGGLGIDLGNNGVTPNGSGPTGPNHYQNYPVLTSVTTGTGWTWIQGTFSSAASTAYTVHFYVNPACDASGNGEGQTYLTNTTVNTDGAGNANINLVLGVGISPGIVVTSTATNPGNDTSEFSACRTAAAGVLPSTTALTSSVNPSGPGWLVTFTATVTGAGPTPTGTVSFYDGATLLGTAVLVGGVATFSTSALAPGTHPMTAVYGGDANYSGSTSAILNQVVTNPIPVLGSVGLVLLVGLLAAVGAALLRRGALGA